MNMTQVEKDIIEDLKELQDEISQYTFILSCAQECMPYPEKYRTEKYLVKDCQVNTWLYSELKDGNMVFLADSESLIVKGALALLQEIFRGRTKEEIEEYECRLLNTKAFTKHLSKTQLQGLRSIIQKAKRN
ncbi:MAG: SufE family protein [Eubacterium sp.]|nr:SufE family protein [Eubacterium sp.]